MAPGIRLLPFDLDTARSIVDGRRDPSWAQDFPAEGERTVAAMIVQAEAAGHVGTATESDPYASPWLVLVDGLAVGGLGFKGRPHDGFVEIGYGLAASARGRGVATAAVAALLALATPDVQVVVAETAVDNLPSQGVLRRLGFAQVDRIEDESDGELLVWHLRLPR